MMLFKTLGPEEAKLKVLKEEDSENSAGILEGYASVFDNVDLGGEVVVKGAFAKTLKERLKKGFIKLYDSHMIFSGTDAVIGVITDAKEDDYGLWFQAKFSSVQKAQEVRTKIREGILSALSFGFEVVKDAMDEAKKIRYLKELRLYEISVVPWGMNPKAMAEVVKGLNPAFMLEAKAEEEPPPSQTPQEGAMPKTEELTEDQKQKKREEEALALAAKSSPIAAAAKDYRNAVSVATFKFALSSRTLQMRESLKAMKD